jgi:hypothetical protein
MGDVYPQMKTISAADVPSIRSATGTGSSKAGPTTWKMGELRKIGTSLVVVSRPLLKVEDGQGKLSLVQ